MFLKTSTLSTNVNIEVRLRRLIFDVEKGDGDVSSGFFFKQTHSIPL